MTMVAYPVAGKKKSHDLCQAFIKGAKHDDNSAVFYGVDESNLKSWRSAEDYWYIDNSYFDATRGTHFRITSNRLQHSGIGHSEGGRFEQAGIEIKPWREAGEHIVICPQSESFMRDIAEYKGNWLKDTIAQLAPVTSRPLKVRAWDRDKIALSQTLPQDLQDAWALVTYSSAAAVTAVLYGVPVVTTGPCAAGPMSGPLSCIETLRKPDDRQTWAGVLADNQFTIDEMRSGEAWERLAHG